jgi:hypothetical protein
MADIRAALGQIAAFVSGHPLGMLGVCAALGLAVMWTSGRKG